MLDPCLLAIIFTAGKDLLSDGHYTLSRWIQADVASYVQYMKRIFLQIGIPYNSCNTSCHKCSSSVHCCTGWRSDPGGRPVASRPRRQIRYLIDKVQGQRWVGTWGTSRIHWVLHNSVHSSAQKTSKHWWFQQAESDPLGRNGHLRKPDFSLLLVSTVVSEIIWSLALRGGECLWCFSSWRKDEIFHLSHFWLLVS